MIIIQEKQPVINIERNVILYLNDSDQFPAPGLRGETKYRKE